MIEVLLDGEEAQAVIGDLRDWLRREDDVDVELATEEAPGKLSGGLATGLILATKAASAGRGVIQSFVTWLKLRQPNVEFTLKKGSTTITLRGNQPITNAMVDNLLRLGEGLTDG